MPSVAVKLYSVFFKLLLKHRLQSRIQTPDDAYAALFADITSRPEEPIAAPNPTFSPLDGIATKDIHIDPLTSLSVRIFLPSSIRPGPAAGSSKDLRDHRRHGHPPRPRGVRSASDPEDNGGPADSPRRARFNRIPRRGSYDGSGTKMEAGEVYGGYLPPMDGIGNSGGGGHLVPRRLPVIVQFHGGAFVAGSNCSVANDLFCRRIAKLLDVIVVAVGYRLAPESRYPAAFDDGFMVLKWLAKQANLAECSKSMGNMRPGAGGGEGGAELRRSDMHGHVVDAFGASMVEPWLAAHGDPSRFLCSPLHALVFFLPLVEKLAYGSVAKARMLPWEVKGSNPSSATFGYRNSQFFFTKNHAGGVSFEPALTRGRFAACVNQPRYGSF
ncbi:hypothetical protein Taro_034613 [Colocasia esculenta]|uniref:Alpha/beta hydrolase fold-3 domain-containing protein n=1 Tax=Colocasia esculenta TaxID=4460 RepID=A0A843W841_COLES|nr:hypothetical protein [Colocasia esculenta]